MLYQWKETLREDLTGRLEIAMFIFKNYNSDRDSLSKMNRIWQSITFNNLVMNRSYILHFLKESKQYSREDTWEQERF